MSIHPSLAAAPKPKSSRSPGSAGGPRARGESSPAPKASRGARGRGPLAALPLLCVALLIVGCASSSLEESSSGDDPRYAPAPGAVAPVDGAADADDAGSEQEHAFEREAIAGDTRAAAPSAQSEAPYTLPSQARSEQGLDAGDAADAAGRAEDTAPDLLAEPALRYGRARPQGDRPYVPPAPVSPRGEGYDGVVENDFVAVAEDPRSTFSIDVDTASYSNVRRFLTQLGSLPPVDAVRIEELVNYFSYEDPAPGLFDGEPFAVSTTVTEAPWRPEHRLVRIGIKGREVPQRQRPRSNLVFLIDVSGSMDAPNKLPLVKRSLRMLLDSMKPDDSVAIVVYAGSSGLVLPPTEGRDAERIERAIQDLRAGGSTNGAAGIQQAYDAARGAFVDGGVNRVILATDGDFNVGLTRQDDLERLIQDEARSGIFLTVLGYGMGNYQDATLETLADRGNGNYGYVDTPAEAHKLLVEELGGTLQTIAKDVKIQVEMNPAEVAAWRLIGYENRALAHRDFNDDGKDAGEIGAGHSLVALYEVVPWGAEEGVDPLRYQPVDPPRHLEGELDDSAHPGELMFLRLRYKQPEGDESELIEQPIRDEGLALRDAPEDARLAAAVAELGLLLRRSPHRGRASWQDVEALVLSAPGRGMESERRDELLTLVDIARSLERRGMR